MATKLDINKKSKRKEVLKREILNAIGEAVEEIDCGKDVIQNLELIKDCVWSYEKLVGAYE